MVADLLGYRALVTGGANGIGAATVELLHERGARVVIADRDRPRGTELCERLGERVEFTRLDVTDDADWERLATTLLIEGPVDFLVHSAGSALKATIASTSVTDFRRIVDLNLTGTFLALQAGARLLTRGGAIVTLSSVRGVLATAELGAYGATKFGVRALSRVAALELAEQGIRVNSVCPGSIATSINDTPGFEDDDMATYVAGIPLRRRGSPDEVAQTIVFLLSPDSAYITGSELVIDGGTAAGRVIPKRT